MDTFSARLNASEGSFFRSEQQNALKRQVAKLVEQGAVSQSVLEKLSPIVPGVQGDVPTTYINARPASERIFQYNGIPVARMSPTESWARLGTAKVSLGRARWSSEGTSIFSIQDGKRLAQTPAKEPTAWEANRQRKIAQAAVDRRVVQGIRLMPEYTPGRAMFWGSIFALWGTGALAASAAKSMDIHTAEEAAGKMRQVAQPMVDAIAGAFDPLKHWFNAQRAHDTVNGSILPVQELAGAMRHKWGREQHA